MDINLIVSQLMIAIYATAVIIPTIQKIKVYFPEKYVELFSMVVSFVIGFLMAWYYADVDYIACIWIGFYAVIGAEQIYKLLSDKMETYEEKRQAKGGTFVDEDIPKSEQSD